MEGTPREMCVLFVDVGQGDATIVMPPVGDPILFDCGRDGWEVTQQLLTYGFDRLEAVVASHLDLDHIGGMVTVLDAYRGRIGAVYFAPDRRLSKTDKDATAKDLTDRVHAGDGQDWELREVHRDGRAIACGAGWSIHLIAPKASQRQKVARTEHWEEPNIYSAVMRVQMGDTSLLVGGDAPLLTWSRIPTDELRATVFRIPHHGGALDDGVVPKGWSAQRLYDAAAPEVAAISVGTNNGHDHPDPTQWTQPLIGRQGCRLLCTQVTGKCHKPFARSGGSSDDSEREEAIRAERAHWLPDPYGGSAHFSEPPWRHYGHRSDGAHTDRRNGRLEVPCAGTISVRIDHRGEVRVDPSPELLDSRIRRWTAPMCRSV